MESRYIYQIKESCLTCTLIYKADLNNQGMIIFTAINGKPNLFCRTHLSMTLLVKMTRILTFLMKCMQTSRSRKSTRNFPKVKEYPKEKKEDYKIEEVPWNAEWERPNLYRIFSNKSHSCRKTTENYFQR